MIINIIPIEHNHINVRLVHAKNDPKTITGIQLILPSWSDVVVSTLRLHVPLKVGKMDAANAQVKIQQVLGHMANDLKQVLILTGQCSNSVLCSCPCCMRELKDKSKWPEWLQKFFQDETAGGPGAFGPLFPDAPLCTGDLAIHKTAALFEEETVGGRLNMTKEEEREIKLKTGSSKHKPLIIVEKPELMHNAGPMHVGAGCTTHMTQTIHETVRKREELMPFWRSVEAAAKEAPEMLKAVKASAEYKSLHSKSKRLRLDARKLERKADKIEESSQQTSPPQRAANTADPSTLREQATTLMESPRSHAEESKYGHFNQLIKGLETIILLLSKHMKDDSKKPRGPAGWAFLQSIEFDAGGKFMAQHSGLEQTNGKGMNTLQNFKKVSEKVVSMYAPDESSTSPPSLTNMIMYAWLKEEFTKYERVAETLYPILTYMKSQEKRDPQHFKKLI